jgi:TonB family protein
MFLAIDSRGNRRLNVSRSACIAMHCALLAWILHAPKPQFLTPNSIASGKADGATVLYFTAEGERQETAATKARLTFPTRARKKQLAEEKALAAQNQKPVPPQAPAGSPYGHGVGGPLFGSEVRPALPVVSIEPKVYPWELGGMEGDVIVEVTIDDHGTIVDKKLVQSFTPNIDSRVLAALEQWQFVPATRDGVPIASKQDISYHFRPN